MAEECESSNNSNSKNSEEPESTKTATSKFDDKRSFSEELDQHKHNIIYAFDYGKEAAKKTEENISAYQKKFLAQCSETPVPDSAKDDTQEQASTSKQILDQKTPHSEKCFDTTIRKRNRCSEANDGWSDQRLRDIPLPLLSWANSTEVWQTMVYKEEATLCMRNCRLFEDPCSFLPRMRAILVDWIMEVCEVYRLRRITYYLAVDYIDRFLTIKPTVPKHQLQLIGISSLFVAAKLEEIYPPKLGEFSYVCDGACSDEDILECEILLLNTLGWDVNPMTPTGWLSLYMQIYFDSKRKQKNAENDKRADFFYPQYSAYQFVLASHLIDLFSLDPGFLLFSYSVTAAGAMYFLFGRETALRVSGLEWNDMEDCTEYMAVFYAIVRDTHDPRLQTVLSHEQDDKQKATFNALKVWIPKLTTDEHHCLQTHVVDLKYFERATLLRLERMGLCVRKTYVKKVIDYDDIKAEEILEEVDENTLNEDESPMILFEIEKMGCTEECKKPCCNASHISDDNVDYFASKTKYTFDEILVGINDCTNKSLLPRRLRNNNGTDVNG